MSQITAGLIAERALFIPGVRHSRTTLRLGLSTSVLVCAVTAGCIGGSNAAAEDSQSVTVAANTIGTADIPSLVVQPPTASGYVSVSDGHLMRDGRRLRQWGVNLQSGVFPTYAEIDLLIERLQSLGFNAIRLWPTSGTFYKVDARGGSHPATAQQGDGSALDRFDYLVAKASQAGMTLQMTMLHYLDLPTLRTLRDPALAPWIQAARDDAELRRLIGIAPYVSDAYKQLLKQHIAHLLTRINPYTQRTYANEPSVSAWELANEGRFVDCALLASCVQSLPEASRSELSRRWQQSSLNVGKEALPGDIAAFIASEKYSGYAQFVADAFIRTSEELRSWARSVAGSESGINRQPFIFNTGPIAPSAVAHYAYSRGDVFSAGTYRSPLVKSGGLDGSPWLPVSVGGVQPSYLNHIKVEDKPFMVYEASFFRPYPYRAEWGPVMAAIALQQDWDGAFLYQYGHPGVIYGNGGRPEGYGSRALPDPSTTSPAAWKRDYTYGFHHGGDPITMASWSIAARLFTSVQETPPLRASWRIPLSSIFATAAGFPPGYFDAASAASKSGAVAVSFVETGTPACLPCVLSDQQAVTFSVAWPDGKQRTLYLRTPGGAAISGQLSGALGKLGDNISATATEPGFGVAAVLRDKAPNGASSAAILQVIGNAVNSGSQFDAGRVEPSSPFGSMRGVLAQGDAPLVPSGPSVVFSAPLALNFENQDFSLKSMGPTSKASQTTFSAASRTFLIRASR